MLTLIAHISISWAVTKGASGARYNDSMPKQLIFHIWQDPSAPANASQPLCLNLLSC